jgi:hypothetical protein
MSEMDPLGQYDPRLHTCIEEGSLQNEPSGHREAEAEPAGQYCRNSQMVAAELPALQNAPIGQLILPDGSGQ